jgi:hypothetical protein
MAYVTRYCHVGSQRESSHTGAGMKTTLAHSEGGVGGVGPIQMKM